MVLQSSSSFHERRRSYNNIKPQSVYVERNFWLPISVSELLTVLIFFLSLHRCILLDDAIPTLTGLPARLGVTSEDFIGVLVAAVGH